MIIKRFLLLKSLVFALACAPAERHEPISQPAGLVFQRGDIYTVDASRSWAQAVAIRGGEITYVGSDQGAKDHIGPDTRVVDLQGRMMLPSFQDVHIHPISAGLIALQLDLSELQTVGDYLAALDSYASANPDLPWIVGAGWSTPVFGPGGQAGRDLLDGIVADRPVALYSVDGHSIWVNSKALEIAGIYRDTPDPDGGRIDRDPATGDAIGSLQDRAMYLVTEQIPEVSLEQSIGALRYAMNRLNRFGITAIQDATEHGVIPRDLDTYRAVDSNGELSLRVVANLWWNSEGDEQQLDYFRTLREEYTHGRVRATSIKIMQDGVMETYTAALLEPYEGSENRGKPMIDPEVLKNVVSRVDAEGFQVHFHAIGDAAVRHCLDAVESSIAQNGDLGHRHHISHLQLIHPDDIPRFHGLGVAANFQPLWALADDYQVDMTMPFLGPERSSWQYPIRSMQDSGAIVAFGSDWSVSSPNPLEEMETAVTRMGALGETEAPFFPEERIDLHAAIAAFTINAAYVNHIDDITGSIEVGKLADLIVLDRNLFELDPASLSDTQVLLTLLEGEPVFGNLSAL